MVRPKESRTVIREYLRWWVEKSRKDKQIIEYETARNEALTVAEAVRKELEKQTVTRLENTEQQHSKTGLVLEGLDSFAWCLRWPNSLIR